MVPEPAARVHMLKVFGIRDDFVENAISSKFRHVWRCLDTINAVHTTLRKLCTADDADSRCEHSLRHDETIDIPIIA